jgi:hypothetical protein
LSVTELVDPEGMVVYRRQTPGGLVLFREEHGYRTVRIDGAPAEFRAKASDLLGKPVDIFFGEDTPVGLPESITILRDEDGRPAAAIAKRGNNLSFSVLNVATAFRTKAKLDLSGEQKGPKSVTVQNLTLTLADDRNHVNLQLLNDGKVVGESTLSADEMDAVITGLGRFRAALNQQVRPEPDESGGAQEYSRSRNWMVPPVMRVSETIQPFPAVTPATTSVIYRVPWKVVVLKAQANPYAFSRERPSR